MGKRMRFLAGAGVGATFQYLYDPVAGRSRRARLRDQGFAQLRDAQRFLGRKLRYQGGRIQGLKHRISKMGPLTQRTTTGSEVGATLDVNRPLAMVYNQWTQFEEFPRFMDGVKEVRQKDDATLTWRAQINGVERSWESRIVEQEADRVIAWQSIGGTRNNGRVTFEALGPTTTRVRLTLDIEPDGIVEAAGDALGLVERQARADLLRFREFIESRPSETGGWRGEIRGGRVESRPGMPSALGDAADTEDAAIRGASKQS